MKKNVKYHFDFIGDKLIIGKFCMIVSGVDIIMNRAKHKMDGITTYPFNFFENGWESVTSKISELDKGDTIIGHDVWLGANVTLIPEVKIGDGANIATKAAINKDVEPFTIVGRNPARVLKKKVFRQKSKGVIGAKLVGLGY